MLEKIIAGTAEADTASPEMLFRAVFATLCEYQQTGRKPGAEHWMQDTREYRPLLVRDVIAAWREAAPGATVFPWHEDFVLRLWVKTRKLKNVTKRSLCEMFDVPVPDRWKSDDDCDE